MVCLGETLKKLSRQDSAESSRHVHEIQAALGQLWAPTEASTSEYRARLQLQKASHLAMICFGQLTQLLKYPLRVQIPRQRREMTCLKDIAVSTTVRYHVQAHMNT